jgi:signal transduction histidine kinase
MGPLEHILAMDRKAAIWFGALVAVLVTVVIGLLLSRLVTSRLSRLAATATGASPAATFIVRGRDEIAALGRALEAMRLRIHGLVSDLAGRDAARRELVAQISHDLRTPLVALLDTLDSAAEHAAVRRDRSLRDWIAAARLDTDRVLSMADDLLELARLDIGQALRIEDVLPEEMVGQIVRGLQPMAERRGLRIETCFDPDLPTMRADGRRLKRVMENLLRNAIQHARHTVLVSATLDEGRVRFVVEDDGPGIKHGVGDEGAESLREDSSGLGLKVARRVVAAHGGHLSIENGPNGGARIGWLMPRS